MDTEWKPTSDAAETFEGRGRTKGDAKWTAQPRRPRLRFELRAPCARGGLRVRRRAGEVRARLRGRVGQGHESRSIRRLSIVVIRFGGHLSIGETMFTESDECDSVIAKAVGARSQTSLGQPRSIPSGFSRGQARRVGRLHTASRSSNAIPTAMRRDTIARSSLHPAVCCTL